jgi:magnesium chelatase family protein
LDLVRLKGGESSAPVADRVLAARERQARRYAEQGLSLNRDADGGVLEAVATPDRAGQALLVEATERLRLSARAYHRILRVARTIADLQGVEGVGRLHIAEALAYRRVAPGKRMVA